MAGGELGIRANTKPNETEAHADDCHHCEASVGQFRAEFFLLRLQGFLSDALRTGCLLSALHLSNKKTEGERDRERQREGGE